MTQELIDKLIDHYEKTISKIKEMPDNTCDEFVNILKFVNDTKTQSGICLCANVVFGEDIYLDPWMMNFSKNNNKEHWFIPAYIAATKDEVLTALQSRVDRMKTFKDS